MCHIFCVEHAMALATVAPCQISAGLTQIREKLSGKLIRNLVLVGQSVLAPVTLVVLLHTTGGKPQS